MGGGGGREGGRRRKGEEIQVSVISATESAAAAWDPSAPVFRPILNCNEFLRKLICISKIQKDTKKDNTKNGWK